MNYLKKKYTDLVTGNVVSVIDQFEDIIVFDNKTRTKANRLQDKRYFDEYIDPKQFFENESLISSFAEKIRQVPLNDIKDEEIVNTPELVGDDKFRPAFNEPAVVEYDPEVEKYQLLEKARMLHGDPSGAMQRQMESIRSILEAPEEDEEEVVQRIVIDRSGVDVENYEDSSDIPAGSQQTIQPVRVYAQEMVDPILLMFKNAKRTVDLKFDLSLDSKIPRIDFIEMMEDSYETSIIEFLAEEITNSLLIDPERIKSKIRDEIKRLVNNKPPRKQTRKKIESTK